MLLRVFQVYFVSMLLPDNFHTSCNARPLGSSITLSSATRMFVSPAISIASTPPAADIERLAPKRLRFEDDVVDADQQAVDDRQRQGQPNGERAALAPGRGDVNCPV